MKYENVTLKDIAKALNLSTSTVSRALRGNYDIGEETKKIVVEYAEKVNYRPNPIALSLKERRTQSIGIVVSEIANNFFSQAINGIESIAYNRGYHVIITQAHESAERERVNIEHLASWGVDGLLISLSSGLKDLTYLTELHEKGMPIVFFDRITDVIDTFKVVADNYRAAFNATEHLIKQNYKRIAHITSSVSLSNSKERLRGYRDALEANGILYNEDLVKYCNYDGIIEAEVQNALNELMATESKVDALLTTADRITTTCIELLKRMQLQNSMGIVGFTNSNLANLFSTKFTAVKQPAFEMGQVATEYLIKLIESKRPVTEFETRELQMQLVKPGKDKNLVLTPQ